MDAVVALTAARSPGQLVSVGLQSGERLLLSTRRLAELSLAPGDELDDRQLAELRQAADDERLEQRVLRLIAVRPRSRAELDRQLEGWGVPAARSGTLLARLQTAGLLDDAAVAEAVSSGLRRRGHGSLRAAYEIGRLGVEAPAAAAAVDEHAAGDEGRARALLASRFGAPPYDTEIARRAASFLWRRGFGEDAVAAAVGVDLDML
ncbi:MAG TPA: regulatory protein RecX [Gaiellales bacterium]|nr:regulatory protein RecX [Gaiellales bacterium]